MLSLIELLNLMYERGGTLTIYRDPSSRGHTAIQIEQAQTKHFGIEIVSDADLRASGGVLLLHALEKVVGKVRAAGKNEPTQPQEKEPMSQAYTDTANTLVERIVALITTNPALLDCTNPWKLFKVPGFECSDLQPSLAQASWALQAAKQQWKRSQPPQETTMACPSCDASMQCVSSKVQDHEAKWHCPRCGTTLAADGQVWVPKLVERVREFVTLGLGSFGPADAGKRQTFLQALSITGVLEAAFLPDDRPKP